MKSVSLAFLVVDGGSGRPVPDAEVELLPFDAERLPVRARTGADGRVVLRDWYRAGGVDYLVGGTVHVTFRPFVPRVAGRGFSEFRAPLVPVAAVPYERATAPPLN